jgi:hypothetical protein
MHGFTNYQQSKALYERGYRHPEPAYAIDGKGVYTGKNLGYNNHIYSFSLADIVTMQGERFYMPPQVSVAEVIEYNVNAMLKQSEWDVLDCNAELREVYE